MLEAYRVYSFRRIPLVAKTRKFFSTSALIGIAVALPGAIYSTSDLASCTTSSVGTVDTMLCVAGGPQLNGKVERSHRSDQQEFYQH